MEKPVPYEVLTRKQHRIRRNISPNVQCACRAHAVRQRISLRAATEQLIAAGFAAYRLDLWYRADPYEAAARGVKLINTAIHPKIYNLVEVYRQEHPCSVRYAIEFLIKQGLAAWYHVHRL